MFKKIVNWLKENKVNLLIISALLLISFIAHTTNMFHYPYYEDDEGTYMSQAWSLITQAKLAPYTYWYDHAPVGWIIIALWTKFTNGFFSFGLSVNSGRVLMLIVHLFSTVFIFLITKRLTKSNLAGIIATLIFSLSPVGIYFQRRVLLDNFMTFWVLLSLLLLLGEKRKLSHYILSAICLGLGILSKEPAVFFLPAFLYIVYDSSHEHHKIIATVKYFVICSTIVSIYILYAVLKGEFFPQGTFLGGITPHVSLIQTFLYQASRKGGFFLNQDSGFRMYWDIWTEKDGLIMLGGLLSTFINLIVAVKNKTYRYISFIVLSFWLFLIRGGEVIEFYITPFIPILGLSIVASLSFMGNILARITKRFYFSTFFLFAFLPIIVEFYLSDPYFHNLYLQDQTTSQEQAVIWVKENIPSNAIVVIDNYAFIDLNSKITKTIYVPSGAQYYWKIDQDPEVKINILNNNWKRIDYMLVTHQMEYDLEHADLDLVKNAYLNSNVLQRFDGDGWYVEIRKVVKS